MNATTTASQRLVGAAEAPLGASAAGAFNIQYDLCRQSTAAGTQPVLNFSGFSYSIAVLSSARQVLPVSYSVVPGAGTWKVGFCVAWSNGATTVSNNDYVNGWVQVVNATASSSVVTSNVQSRAR